MYMYVYKNNKKTFSIKMKGDVGTLKPKKHVNKVGRLTYMYMYMRRIQN